MKGRLKDACHVVSLLAAFSCSGCLFASVGTNDPVELRFTYWGGPLEREAVETLIATFNVLPKEVSLFKHVKGVAGR